MNWSVGSLIVLQVTVVTSGSNIQVETTKRDVSEGDEARLLKRLLHSYENAVRPVDKASDNITVQLGFSLTQILDMDEKNQVLTTNVWFSQQWRDEMLRWNPDDYSGLKTLRLPTSLIWKPDIVLYNGVEEASENVYSQCLAMVSYDGTVFWAPNANLRSSCKLDLTFFPFDDQVCSLKFGSWAYDGFQVDLINMTSELTLDQYIINGGWDLLETKVVRHVVRYPCCPETFPDVTFTVYLRRRTLYYVYNFILPCLLLSVLSLLGFWLPVGTGEKVTLGLTVLLAFFVLGLSMADRIPETSEYIPLIGVYLNCIMILTTISIILCVFTIHLHNSCSTKQSTSALSIWFYTFTMNYLSRLSPCSTSAASTASSRMPDHGHSTCRNEDTHHIENGIDEEMSPLHPQNMDEMPLFKTVPMEIKGSYMLCLQQVGIKQGESSANGKFCEQRNCQDEAKMNWKRVAEIWDMLFFWIELFTTSFCTVVILLIIPACKQNLPM